MRKQALLMIPLLLILAGCAGRVSSAPPTSPPSATPTVVAAPSPPLDCSTLFDQFNPAPDSAAGVGSQTLVPAAGGSECTWISTIWESVTLVVIPQVESAVPASTCDITDEGGGDHQTCRFDSFTNGYRLSGYIGGPQEATASDVLASTKPIVAAFAAAASAAVPGGAPAARPAPIDCAAIDFGDAPFTDRQSDGQLGAMGIGPSLQRADLFPLAGAKECESGDIRVTVIPAVPDAAAYAKSAGGETEHVTGADVAEFTGDSAADLGANIFLSVDSTLVQISQGSRSRATQLELCDAVLAALAR